MLKLGGETSLHPWLVSLVEGAAAARATLNCIMLRKALDCDMTTDWCLCAMSTTRGSLDCTAWERRTSSGSIALPEKPNTAFYAGC